MTKILFVCLGNICRSPTAEGVMQHILETRGLSSIIKVDSAGTGGWHEGERADSRSREVAGRRGFELHSRARKFGKGDFQDFDYIFAMDRSNYGNILQQASTVEEKEKVHMFRSFDAGVDADAEVPDPYYGGPDGFERVFDICFSGCEAILRHLEKPEA